MASIHSFLWLPLLSSGTFLKQAQGVHLGPWGEERQQLKQNSKYLFLLPLNNQISRCEEGMLSSVREGDQTGFLTICKVVSHFHIPWCGRGAVGSSRPMADRAGFPTSHNRAGMQEPWYLLRAPARLAYPLILHLQSLSGLFNPSLRLFDEGERPSLIRHFQSWTKSVFDVYDVLHKWQYPNPA